MDTQNPDATDSTSRTAWTLGRWIRTGAGKPGRSTDLLTMAAVAAATLIVLLTASVGIGLGNRIDHSRWTYPQESAQPTMVQATTTRYLGDRTVRVVHLAPTSTAATSTGDTSATAPSAASTSTGDTTALPAPPGMDHFPTAGEQWVSPALAEMVEHDDPMVGRVLSTETSMGSETTGTGITATNTPATFDGVLSAPALSAPNELIAVIGHDANDPAMTGQALHDLMRSDDQIGPVGISDFAGAAATQDNELAQYRWLALVGAVLLIVPAMSLAAAGARLGAARRMRRLALLRLSGLDRRTLAGVTLADALPPAMAGAAAGTLLYLTSLPFAARVPLIRTRWFVWDLWVGPLVLLAVWTTVMLITAASALVPLRAILADPIGVADHHAPGAVRWWRVFATVATIAGFLFLTSGDDADVWMVIAALALLFTTLNVIGPVLICLIGWMMVRRAHNGVRLIAGRRLLGDPNGAWRQVAAVSLASFIAGFLALFSVANGNVWGGDSHTLMVAVASRNAAAAADMVRDDLNDALALEGLSTNVAVSGNGGSLDTVINREGEISYLQVGLDPDPATSERIRRVVARTLPTAPQATGTDVIARDDRFAVDFRSATIVILTVAFVIASTGTAITSAASVIDRRTTYKRLYRAGAPFALLDGSRTAQVITPALLATVGGAAMGLVAASPITLGSASIDVRGLLILIGTITVGVTAMRLGVAASRPALRRMIGAA